MKKYNRSKTADMMETFYEKKKEREAEENWRFT